MATARDRFLRRLQAFNHVVQNTDSLEVLRHQPADRDADDRARLLRNGLAVSGFALLEDFLASRVGEILTRVSGSSLAFGELPDKLQSLCTTDVVSALRFQVDMRRRAGDDVTGLIQATGRSLASTSQRSYELSELAFGHSRSNIGHGDIKELLRAFNVPDGWDKVTRFAQRMGLASLNLRDDFIQATKRRHLAAHDPSVDTALGDLQNFPAQALGVAAGCDALLSRAAYNLLRGDRAFARNPPQLDQSEIRIRFLIHDGTVFRDIAEDASRAAERGANRDQVIGRCRSRAARKGAVIVFQDRNVTASWEPSDLTAGRP
jgi:hypothetical protein